MVLKAEHAHQQLLLVVEGLRKLFADENFVNLLRGEELDTLPKYLSDQTNRQDCRFAQRMLPERRGIGICGVNHTAQETTSTETTNEGASA